MDIPDRSFHHDLSRTSPVLIGSGMSTRALLLAQSVTGRIMAIAAVTEHRVEHEVLRPVGLTLLSWRVLDHLSTWGTKTFTQIAEDLHLAKGSLSGVLAKLESEGLVSRQPDERDGRRVLVELTARGRAVRRELAPRVHAVEVRGYDQMPESDLIALDSALANCPDDIPVLDPPPRRRPRRDRRRPTP